MIYIPFVVSDIMAKNVSADRVTKMRDAAMNEVLQPTRTSLMYQGTSEHMTHSTATDMSSVMNMDVTTIVPYFGNHTEDINGSLNGNLTSGGPMDYACLTIETEFQVMLSHQVFLYASLSFIIIGLIGNSLSTLVFSSKGMRTVSSNSYLLVLALSDSAYLVSVFLTKVLTTLRCMHFANIPLDIFNRSSFWCLLLQFLMDLFSDYSTCLILAFTIERYIACYHPVKFKEICTVRRARIACMILFLICCGVIAPYHMLYIKHYSEYNMCTVHLEHELTFTIWYIIECLLFRIVPVFIIAVLNVFIIIKVTRLNQERRRRASSRVTNNNKKKISKDERHIQLTIMLILVSTSYIIVYLPVLIHFVMWKLERSQVISVGYQAMIIAQNYTRTFYISGFAINFFLYTLSGRIFREQLECILCVRFNKYKTYVTNFVTEAETTTLVTKL